MPLAINSFVGAHTHIHTHTHTCTHTHAHVHTHVHTHIHTRIHTHTHTHVHTHVYTHTHTYTHTYLIPRQQAILRNQTHASQKGWYKPGLTTDQLLHVLGYINTSLKSLMQMLMYFMAA